MKALQTLVSAFIVSLLLSCSPLIAGFDQTAYTQVTSLKVDALDVMSKANEHYTQHETEIKSLQLNIDKAIEYDKHRPKNENTVQMWELLNSPTGHLLGGYFVRWKQKTMLDTAFISDQKKIIGRSFDRIAELESKKIKPSQINN